MCYLKLFKFPTSLLASGRNFLNFFNDCNKVCDLPTLKFSMYNLKLKKKCELDLLLTFIEYYTFGKILIKNHLSLCL